MEHYEQYPAILMWIFQQPRMWWNTISHKSPIGDGQFEIGKNIKWYPAQIEMNIAGFIGLFHTFPLFSASVSWGMIAVYLFFTEHIFPLVSKDRISKISKDWPRAYPLVNVYIAVENHHFEWRNQQFLWPFSIANCNKLTEAIKQWEHDDPWDFGKSSIFMGTSTINGHFQ